MLQERLPFLVPALLLAGVADDALTSRADAGPVGPDGGTPDLIVGDIYDWQKYGTSGGLSSYAFGTVSCNMGTEVLTWNANTNVHPVISATIYRLKDGILEQVALNWLKHGFSTLNGTLCGQCQPTGGTTLGILCSDPYSASLNGSQNNLGPRTDVNAYDGFFPYPPSLNSAGGVLGGRIQAPNAMIDPALNVGARYFVEAQYVHPQDSAKIGNGDNNVAYREIRFNAGVAPWSPTLLASTAREQTVFDAWKSIDPTVTVSEISFPQDGSIFVGSKAIQNSPNSWTYVYVVYNRDSNLGARALGVPLNPSVNVTARTFHDVAYHSGETVYGTDWTEVDGPLAGKPRVLGWYTGTFAQDPNHNAIRWGTAYTMTFTCDRAPGTGKVAVASFKASSPSYRLADAVVPQ
jgi:hypothetical protein